MRKWLFRLFSLILILFVVACAGIWLLEFYPRHGSASSAALAKGTLAIEHARIYISPTDPPIEDGTVLVRDGRIGSGKQVAVPADARIVALRPLRGNGRLLEYARALHRAQMVAWRSGSPRPRSTHSSRTCF